MNSNIYSVRTHLKPLLPTHGRPEGKRAAAIPRRAPRPIKPAYVGDWLWWSMLVLLVGVLLVGLYFIVRGSI